MSQDHVKTTAMHGYEYPSPVLNMALRCDTIYILCI